MPLSLDPGVTGGGGRHRTRHIRTDFSDAGYSGHSFNLGLLRFHDSETAPTYVEHVLTAFPELQGKDADLLAFDWMGRQLVTTATVDGSESDLLIADLGVGEVSHFCTVAEFTGIIKLPESATEAFNGALYEEWKRSVGGEGQGIAFSDCVEYQTPLYLGGDAGIGNLVLNDLDVAWTIGSQIRAQTRHLKPGESVTISL